MSKVLVVDDEATRGGTIREALERGGFETASASDGNEALRTFLTEVPDLVMVGPIAADPDEGFCRRMRETRPGSTTPIILFGESLRGEGLKQALQRSGCDAYVEVPASQERLVEACLQAIGGASGPGVHATQARPDVAAAAAAAAAEGQDIEDYLDSMFETGTPPARAVWTAEPEVSFDTDLAPRPLATQFDEPGARHASPADGELLGFEPDAVTIGDAAPTAPGRHPDQAAETLPPALRAAKTPPPAPREAETMIAPPAPRPVVAPHNPIPPVESLDFALDEPAPASRTAAMPDELPPEIAAGTSTSRTWLWAVGAVVLLAGAAGLFFMLRPATGSAEPTRVAAALPEPMDPAPRPVAPIARIAAPSGATESAEPPVADPGADDADAASVSAGAEPASADATDDPGEASDATIAQADEGTITAAVKPDPRVAGVDATPPAARPVPTETAAVTPAPTKPVAPRAEPAPPAPAVTAAADPPAPKPNRETVFVPSMEAMDVDTAGPGFAAPQAINLVAPQYASATVQPGGESVVLKVLVNDWGKVVRVVVERGRAGSPLVEAAINAVLETRYRPAVNKGQDVRAWTRETFVFR